MSLTQLRQRKCRACGYVPTPDEGHECASCGEHDKWLFFCQRHNKMFASPVCDICEEAARREEEAREAAERERERLQAEAEERERRRREYEREQQRQLEEDLRREKKFVRAIMIPTYVALVVTLLCMGLTVQLFTHGEFVIPYTFSLLLFLFGLGISATLSIFLIAAFFGAYTGPT